MSFTVAIAVVIDDAPCLKFHHHISEATVIRLVCPRGKRGDVVNAMRDLLMWRVPVHDRETGHPFAFIQRDA